jgi:hypothetical protein
MLCVALQDLTIPHIGSARAMGGLMIPTRKVCLDRMQSCITDLSQNGIDLAAADGRGRARLVTEHLEYFQFMLGYDSDPAEILDLLKNQAGKE